MIDIKRIKNHQKEVEVALSKRMGEISLDNVVKLYDEKNKLLEKVEGLRQVKNTKSKEISKLKSQGVDITDLLLEMKQNSEESAKLSKKISEIEETLFNIVSALPNIPDDDVLAGGKENNQVLSTYLEQPKYDFNLKDHTTVATELNLIDYKRGVKLGGQGSWIYTGVGAQLEWALINFFINSHLEDNWQFMLVPHMLNYECGYTAGQFPKFNDEVYWLDGGFSKDGKFILPTAETALINVHRDEILSEDELPKKYFAYTPCYRREAGSSRVEERGTVRGHQFNKVEMIQFTAENDSDRAFEEMLEKAERLVKELGLHYRLSKLAAGDCSAGMARTYDIEVWIPSMGIYKEVSSVSNARDYQARRGNMKYRDKETGKIKFVHTLNASGLATSRVVPAILEQYQQADGSVVIPEVLRNYMGGMEKISPNAKVRER